MTEFLSLAAVVLSISLGLGLVRVFKGPSIEDRMMSVQLVGTTGVGMLLILAPLLNMPSSVDAALVLALLAAVSAAALTRRERRHSEPTPPSEPRPDSGTRLGELSD
jgi:multicomponent Na+:H+ antiporter subunit F